MVRKFEIMLYLLGMLMFGATLIRGTRDRVALLSESISQADESREVGLLPDHLNVRLTTADDGVVQLNLKRMKNIDHNKINIQFDHPNLSRKDLHLETRIIGYYQDPTAVAAISVEARIEDVKIKRSLTGTFVHGGKMYEIRPAKKLLQSVDKILEERGMGRQHSHRVHIMKEVDAKFMDVDKAAIKIKETKQELKKYSNEGHSKRQSVTELTEYHLELAFLVDYDVYKDFLDDAGNDAIKAIQELTFYYNHLLNGIYLAYDRIEDPDIKIIIWLSELKIVTLESNTIVNASTIVDGQFDDDKVFDSIKDFLSRNSVATSDLNMLWTRKDLTSLTSKNERIDVLGVAFLCGVCIDGIAMSQNEDNGLVAWHTAAHELGHNLGSRHDSPISDGGNGCTATMQNIMHDQDYAINNNNVESGFKFSTCSVNQFKTCIRGLGSSDTSASIPKECLANRVCAHGQELQGIDELPGTRIDATEQCQLYNDDPNASYDAFECSNPLSEICQTLVCAVGDFCVTTTLRAASGTKCNEAGDMVCDLGICKKKSDISSSIIDDVHNPGCQSSSPSPATTKVISPATTPTINNPATTKVIIPATTQMPNNPPTTKAPATTKPTTVKPSATSFTTNSGTPSDKPPVYYCIANDNTGGVRCPANVNLCIPYRAVCNGINNCPDGADEDVEFCKKVPAPNSGSIRCPDKPAVCTDVYYYGTYFSDCADESPFKVDYWRANAPRNCDFLQGYGRGLPCPNNQSICIPEYWACDGDNDCKARPGEIGDESNQFCKCGSGESPCKDQGHQCIRNTWVYDRLGIWDCFYGSDEDTTYLQDWCQELPTRNCKKHNFQNCPGCGFLKCIKESWKCDGYADCLDGSDESPQYSYCSNDKRESKKSSVLLNQLEKSTLLKEMEEPSEINLRTFYQRNNYKHTKHLNKLEAMADINGRTVG